MSGDSMVRVGACASTGTIILSGVDVEDELTAWLVWLGVNMAPAQRYAVAAVDSRRREDQLRVNESITLSWRHNGRRRLFTLAWHREAEATR